MYNDQGRDLGKGIDQRDAAGRLTNDNTRDGEGLSSVATNTTTKQEFIARVVVSSNLCTTWPDQTPRRRASNNASVFQARVRTGDATTQSHMPAKGLKTFSTDFLETAKAWNHHTEAPQHRAAA